MWYIDVLLHKLFAISIFLSVVLTIVNGLYFCYLFTEAKFMDDNELARHKRIFTTLVRLNILVGLYAFFYPG